MCVSGGQSQPGSYELQVGPGVTFMEVLVTPSHTEELGGHMRLTGLTATQPGGKPCVQVGTWLSPLAFRGLRGSLGWRPALLPPARFSLSSRLCPPHSVSSLCSISISL